MLSGGWRRVCMGGGVEEAANHSSITPSLTTMLYYTFEPQFSALIFSISARHEKINIFPDPFASFAHGPGWGGSSDVLAYVHTLGVQLAAVGDHYACLLTQVRAGSVIFLVGVGSLVCWRLWEHWRAGGGCSPSLPPPPSPPHSKESASTPRPKGILASLLEEDLIQDPDDFEDEDPAFIHGKYFGPSSPCDDASLSTDISETGSKHYLADASNSYNRGDEGVVSSSEASLPTDEDSDADLRGGVGGRRVVRRRHRTSHRHNHLHLTHTHSTPSNGIHNTKENGLAPNCHPTSAPTAHHAVKDDWLSSESSPENYPTTRHRHTRHPPPYATTPESEDTVERRQRLLNMPRRRDDDAPWKMENKDEMECDDDVEMRGMAHSVSSASLADLMDKLRQRAQRGTSLSRDNSVASNLSDILSPMGSRRFIFRREDSVCSNISGISDIAPSECSEASLDVSVKDLPTSTFTCLDNIEHELDDLKSSVLEMDQEVTKFTSRPDPYTFKTTYSDLGSGESRPPSAMDVSSPTRSRFTPKTLPSRAAEKEGEVVESDQWQQTSEASGSMEWDSPQHGWSSSRPRPLSLPPTLPSYTHNSSHNQDDPMPSLEWDNGCLRQYSEEHPTIQHETIDDVFHASVHDSLVDLEGFEEYKLEHSRHQLLPDHSSLELDLEEELQSADRTITKWDLDLPPAAPMTTSVDSAIHSGPGSRSTSSSPIPPLLNRSLLSSSGLASSCEISPATPDSEGSGWGWWERRGGVGREWGSKSRRVWSSEESGFMDTPDTPTPLPPLPHDALTHAQLLSPLHEIKEKEYTDSSNSTPLHQGQKSTTKEAEKTNKNNVINEKRIEELNSVNEKAEELTNKNNTDEKQNKNAEKLTNKNNTEDEHNKNAGLTNENTNHINNNFIMGNKTSSERRTPNSTDNQTRGSGVDREPRDTLTSRDAVDGAALREGPVAVGPRVALEEYAGREWQGNTPKALTMRQGYAAIPDETRFTHLRQVRGDNYCGVRAAVYQVLTSGVPMPPAAQTHARLASHITAGATWLNNWSFARRLNISRDREILDTFWQCLDALESLGSKVTGCENCESVVSGALQADPILDIRVCEAVKLHMMAAALDLHTANTRGDVVPLFAMIMFARHSSTTPRQLMANHLNPVGDSAGLEQIEMFLLGWSLGVTVRVVRPGSYGADDYICYYPDSNMGVWPQVTLVAEDDRHYNVLVK